MKKLLPILIGLSLSGFSTLSQAENLMQVYQQARLSNPELRKSAADRDAAFEKINEARSPLLPQLGLGADYTSSTGYRDANGVNSNATSASLQLTQTLFDMSKWRALTLQEKSAGIQDVTYQTDQQTLILNTATAYFNVLNAIDVLSMVMSKYFYRRSKLSERSNQEIILMYGSGNQPVIVLKEGTERSKDKEAQFNNIAAAKAVADAVRSTLGPKGMDKMLVNTIGDVVITNDGVTILKEIDVQHPAAKMVVEVAKTQDSECGDGTTTSVVLAGELLKQSEELINANVHPTVITNGYKMASTKAVEILNDIAVDVKSDKVLKQVAATALTGKSVGEEEEALADIVVKACKSVEENGVVDTKNIRIQKKIGGVIGDTYLVQGIVVDKEKVHSRMPTHVEKAKIALFSCPLEIKKTEFDAQIQITDPTAMSSFLAEEENELKAMVEKIKSVGANVVFSQKGVDELVQHYLAKNGILGYRRLKQSDLEAIAKATGATIVGHVQELTKNDLGTAGAVDEKLVGEDGMAFITGCKNPKAITIFVRGGTEHVLEEVERALNDAIRVVGVAMEDGKVVAGAGAPEIELELRLMDYAASVGGREQLAIEKFAKAMEIIPWTLSENAGIDPIDSIIKLKNAHEKKAAKAKYFGIDLDSGEAVDMLAKNVVEPLRVKVQAINSAEEVANMILRIDDVIASRRAPPAPAGGPQGGMPPM